MKNLLITAALILAAGSASAMNAADTLSGPDAFTVRLLVPGADVDNLTAAQVGAIGLTLTNDGSARGAYIRSVLNQS